MSAGKRRATSAGKRRAAGAAPAVSDGPPAELDGPPALPDGPPEDERSWLEDELSLIVGRRREVLAELDQANRELGAARREASRLSSRRAVRIAVVAVGAARPVRSLLRRVAPAAVRRLRPGSATSGVATSASSSVSAATPHPTPAEFRSAMLDRLARPDGTRTVIVETPDAPVDDLRAADIVAITTPDFDVRRVRGPVTVAVLGTGWEAWLDKLWLDDFDIVATAEPAARDAIAARHATTPTLIPDPIGDIPAMVSAWLAARRLGIAVGIPRWEEAPAWGDLHFARALQRQFERSGHPTRVHILPDWIDEVSARDDVSIHLFGLRPRSRVEGQLNLLWVISHPDKVTDEMAAAYDRIYAASDVFAEQLAERTHVPVAPLHQATDPERFHPDPTGPRHDVLFVGNSRGTRRDILADLTPTSLGLAVYGQGWTPELLDPAYLKGEHVPNEDLHRFYSSAGVVLNDHWADMRATGFFSNRLYDALASGACVVSDHVDGIEAEFDGAIVTYTNPARLRFTIRDLLLDPNRRRELAERGRAAVLERHTFAHRAARLMADIDQALPPASS